VRFYKPPDHGEAFIKPFLHFGIIQLADGVHPFAFDENYLMV